VLFANAGYEVFKRGVPHVDAEAFDKI